MDHIVVKDVSKKFGKISVLNKINVSFKKGEIYGLIGRNGAGKTVLLKLICGLAEPTEGEIFVNEKRTTDKFHSPESIGAIIETPGFLENNSGFNNLKYLAKLRNKISDAEIISAMTTVGLDYKSKKHVGKYSLGMRQRLGIAQAIMENPDILLLDEPMNGLDNKGVEDIKTLLHELKKTGKTIILASHHMEDICELCSEVFAMDGGMLKKLTEEELAIIKNKIQLQP